MQITYPAMQTRGLLPESLPPCLLKSYSENRLKLITAAAALLGNNLINSDITHSSATYTCTLLG